jgi:putative redox protein
MPTKTVRADWIEDQVFLLRDSAGFPVVMTQPNGVNGSDLLTMSLIGCAAWDVVSILRKQRQHLTKLEISADTEQDADPPWRIRRIRIHFMITGKRVTAGSVRRAIDLTETKYCSVFATLREAVEIRTGFEIREDNEQPG